jgi:hypothetical protein
MNPTVKCIGTPPLFSPFGHTLADVDDQPMERLGWALQPHIIYRLSKSGERHPTCIIRTMTRKLTITVSDEVYKGVHEKIGPGKISRFLDRLARPEVAIRQQLGL